MRGGASIFDTITPDDLIMAFFPCIYFCENNQLYFMGQHHNIDRMSPKEKADVIIERSNNRNKFYQIALKMFATCDTRGIRLITENPYASQHFLVNNFPYRATLIDRNRALRGDFYKKPTQYWFINCNNTIGYACQKQKNHYTIAQSKPSSAQGLCSEERSMISPDYARNFICDFILGKEQEFSERTLF